MLEFKPLTIQTWPYLKKLFGDKGACGGCWCMYWRLMHKQYELQKGAKNKKAFQTLIQQEDPLGIIAMDSEVAIGWCSVSPKTSLVRLSRSRLFRDLEQKEGTWSITCLFVRKDCRNKGLSSKLIAAAAHYAFEQGATQIEGYPIIPQQKHVPPLFAYVGFDHSFTKAGFKEVVRVSSTRSVMLMTPRR